MLTTTHARARRHRDERGLALPLMSLILIALLVVSALVVDLGSWQVEASRVQQAADSAALAGVVMLPEGDSAAIARAHEVAIQNGYDDDDDGITVTVTPLPEERLEVAITTENTDQYLSDAVRDDGPTITRRSTAQYVQPVPLGSPRNYLGTNTLLSQYGLAGTNGIENFFLAVSGKCTERENGDRIATKAMNIGNGDDYSCDPPNGGSMENPEYEERGYLFGVTVPPDAAGDTVRLQMYDAPHCPGIRGGTDFNGESLGNPVDYEVTVREYDDLDPYEGSDMSSIVFQGSHDGNGICERPDGANANRSCTSTELLECWTTIHTLSPAAAGQYVIQINPLGEVPTQTHNLFALRAETNGAFTPCSADPAIDDADAGVDPTPGFSSSCVQVYGLEHLPLAARGTTEPTFFLSDIGPQHAGKVLEVTLFDSGEGAGTIELIDPSGTPADFTWQVLCADASVPESPWSCPETGDAAPIDLGSDGNLVDVIDVSGTVSDAYKTFPNNDSASTFNDRLLRLRVQLPTTADPYSGATWWKIRYTGSFGEGENFAGDRTTWSVRLLGDPVRLLPNRPPSDP